jgi:hypothetical protein
MVPPLDHATALKLVNMKCDAAPPQELLTGNTREVSAHLDVGEAASLVRQAAGIEDHRQISRPRR